MSNRNPGFILPDSDRIPDAKKLGTVTVSYDEKSGSIDIRVEGFEWAEPMSCREAARAAELWASKLLALSAERGRLAPGGYLSSGID